MERRKQLTHRMTTGLRLVTQSYMRSAGIRNLNNWRAVAKTLCDNSSSAVAEAARIDRAIDRAKKRCK